MAGWADSGSSRGRGGGGFANRGVNNMNTRWRERRPAQHQQQQHQEHQQQQHPQHQEQQYQQHQQQTQQHHQQHQQQQQQRQQHRYRPVHDNDQSSQHLHHSPAEEPNQQRGQGGFSTSTRRPQPTRLSQASPIFRDHKSPAPAANANVSANESDDKAKRNAANFECNVCFDMADDPVVTKCGHLFCWECLYQWLHVHSHHRECPVCKGQVADDAIIPIYGRGGSAASVHAAPPRPTGARVESSRQQQQQAALDWHMVDDDEDDNPLDAFSRLAFGGSVIGSSVSLLSSIMPDLHMGIEDYDSYINPYHHHDFDDYVEDLDFPAFASAGAGSSRGHGHHTADSDETMGTFVDNTNEVLDFLYGGGRRQSGRARGARYADRSSMVMGGSSSSSYRDTGAGPRINNNNNTGAYSRPNGGWTERRGRSNRNSNSGGGRGMQNNSRRQGANYN
ncbi:unnamed protein product [Alopecurus aequalis]